MYKVILVDDDELVRVGLESLVSFSKKGFQIIDSLSNAKQALDSIRKNQPDVVITDMYMPEINGVQLIREGKQLCPSAIFIVLSCQNNIDFIKEALRAGATDYLLKSSIVNPKSTASLLDKISDACQMRHRLSGTAPAESDPKAMLREYLRGGAVSPENLRQELYRRGFDAANGGLHLSALQFNHYESMSSCSGSEEALLAKIEQYIDGFLSEYGAGLCVHDEKGCFLLLQQIRASALSITADDRLLSICERLRLCVRNTFLHTCSIYVCRSHHLEELPAAAEELAVLVGSGAANPDSIFPVASDPEHSVTRSISSGSKSDPINNVIRYIERNYASPITLDELAGIANFSKYHLCRKFKDATNMGIVNYILLLRINKAKELLLESDLYVFEISQQVGFNDTSYFNRTFKRITGLTPNEFQSQSRRDHQ